MAASGVADKVKQIIVEQTGSRRIGSDVHRLLRGRSGRGIPSIRWSWSWLSRRASESRFLTRTQRRIQTVKDAIAYVETHAKG